ncbi:MAG TPA: response regulator transcription factor [Mycobacteriales bacterium]|jgi:DNA-binding NarL/FixJ family response regulator|nr:response regulator transcription factor [Mycobacteriales bacterium]
MRIPVHIAATDPISEAGVAAALRPRPELRLVDPTEVDETTIGVVVAQRLDDSAMAAVRSAQRRGCVRIVLVPTELDDADLVSAAEAGICGVVPRSEATPERLVRAIEITESGNGSLPPDLIGRLLNQVSRLHRQVLAPRGLSMTGLSDRETSVLRLVAEGMDTHEIAGHLAYSERTVKNVLHDITSRLQLRNRSHAVAYALREGLI